MEKFEPIGLRSSQFGLIAAVTVLSAWIPNLVSIPPILHVVKMDINERTPTIGKDGLMVEVLESGEVRSNGLPVTLHQLSILTGKLKPQRSQVVLRPDPCAPYGIVILTIVALKKQSPESFSFADPDYSPSFGKAPQPLGHQTFDSEYLSNAGLNNEKSLFRSKLASTIFPSTECRTKAFSDWKPDVTG